MGSIGFDLLLVIAALVAGAIGSVAGFGIGSLLTPVFAWRYGTSLAISVVSVPHLIGTALRFWMLRSSVDRRLLWTFGIASALCGLIGALLHSVLAGPVLSRVFGGLLILAAISSITGMMARLRLGRAAAWIAGGLSGIFGGLVGNQGSIRSAALLGFQVRRDAFVATATAIALLVDAGRIPVYMATQFDAVARLRLLLVIAVAGVVTGTIVGARLLRKIPESVFHRIVGMLLICLGIYMLVWPSR